MQKPKVNLIGAHIYIDCETEEREFYCHNCERIITLKLPVGSNIDSISCESCFSRAFGSNSHRRDMDKIMKLESEYYNKLESD